MSSVVPGTNVVCHHSSTMESVPATVVGPSKLDGDFLSIRCEGNGKTVTHDCAPLHRLESRIHSPSPSSLGNDSDHPEASRKEQQPIQTAPGNDSATTSPPPPRTPATKNARWLFPPGASIEHIAQCRSHWAPPPPSSSPPPPLPPRWHNRPREWEGKEWCEADGHCGLRRERPREGKGKGRGKVRAGRKRKVKGR